jgi:VWFA-related protein
MTIRSVLRICLPAITLLALLPAGAQSTTPAAPAQTAPAQTAPAPAAGQTPGPGVASAVGALSLPVTVVDDKGNAVKNVAAADLKLTDNGEAQTIQSFAPAAPTPMAIAIIGQTSAGLRAELGDERLSSVHFVDHTLPGTQDQFVVIDYAGEVDLLADPTSTASKLHDAINQMGSPQFGSQNGGDSSDQSSTNTHGSGMGGTLNDAIYLAATEELKKLPGQHVIVLISDGIDHDSKETMSDAIEAAQAAHVAIFAIYYKSEEQPQHNPNDNNNRHGGGFPGGGGGYPGGGGGYPGGNGGGRRGGGQNPTEQPHEDGRQNLIHICDATGGFMVEGKRDKGDDAYNKIAALLKSQYTLTFVPSKAAQDSDFQRLSLTTEKKDAYPKVQEGLAAQPLTQQ